LKEKDIDAVRKILRDVDAKTFEERAARRKDLPVVETSLIDHPWPYRTRELLREAQNDYEKGCYRSCIFSCAAVVEQAFRHQILEWTESVEGMKAKYEKMERYDFGDVINEAKKIEGLRRHLKDADWLRQVRNKIAVHPSYVVLSDDSAKWTAEFSHFTLRRDLRRILSLQFLSTDIKDRIRSIELGYKHEKKGAKRPITVDEFLRTKQPDKIRFWEYTVSERVLRDLALEGCRKMTAIIENLFPVLETRKMREEDVDICIEIMLMYEPRASSSLESARQRCVNPEWEHNVILFKEEIVGLVNYDTAKTFQDGISIHDIYIKSDFRHRRAGTRLVSLLERECRMRNNAFLYAISVQERARSFFEGLDFKQVSAKGKDVPLIFRKKVES